MQESNRGWIVVLAVVLLVLILWPGFGWGMMGWGMMGPGMMGSWGGALHPLWAVAMMLVWALLFVGVVLAALWGVRQAGLVGDAGRRPLDILKERYARGEITREQFEQMRRDLE